jgi:hypothetical protein
MSLLRESPLSTPLPPLIDSPRTRVPDDARHGPSLSLGGAFGRREGARWLAQVTLGRL